VTHFCNFGIPYISGAVEARNFKLGKKMEGREYLRKNIKIRSEGVMWGYMTHFLNFGTLYIRND